MNITYEEGAGTFTLLTAAGAGGMLGITNDTGKDFIITCFAIDIATRATADSLTIDAGINATSIATSGDNLIDGASISAVGILTSGVNGGTNGKTQQVWKNGTHLTVSCNSAGDPAGLVGTVRIKTMRLM